MKMPENPIVMRQTEVRELKEILNKQLTGLEDLVSEVGLKFADAMSLPPPAPDKRPEEKKSYTTPLAMYFDEISDRIDMITRTVESYCARCEL
jgi:hypothetical protein